VLLRVAAAGICHSDLHINDGFFDLGEGRRAELGKLGASLPLTLGHEIVGVVEALGPDAEGVEIGAPRVAFPWIGCRQCAVCEHEREQLCLSPKFLGARVHGGYSEYVIVPHPKYLIDYGNVPTELACTFACAGLTAYAAIRKVAPLAEDDYLMLIGAGGVGLSGLHIAPSVVPAKLIVADVDPQKRGIARQAGAYETIDNSDPDAVAKVIELTGGGVRASIDFVGAPQTARFGLDILRRGGSLINVGLFGGAMALPLPLMPQRSLTLRGSYVGTLEEMEEVMALGRAGKVPPIPLDLRSLSQAAQALDDLRAGRVAGRVILKPDA
jgi:D-arabinose 1-dehydrogenase-like Zn-dependent alcohol dehydrogenase